MCALAIASRAEFGKGIDTESGEDRSGGSYHFGVASGKFGAPLNRISDVETHTIYRLSFRP